MAIEFLDEAPPAAKTGGGFEFVDAPASGGFEFTSDKATPPDPKDVAARLADPRYVPTQSEYEVWKKQQDAKPWFQPEEWATKAKDAAESIKDLAVNAVKTLVTKPADGSPEPDAIQTVLEGAARGTAQDLATFKKVAQNVETLGGGLGLNFQQFATAKLGQANEAAFPQGHDANATLLTLNDVPAKTLGDWKREFDEQYKSKEQYQDFLDKRADVVQSMDAAKTPMVPEITGKASLPMADALSLVASPISLATLGAGAGEHAGASLLQRAAGAGARGAGTILKAGGRVAELLADLPGQAVGKGVEFLSDNPGLGDAAANAARTGEVGVADAAPRLTLPGMGVINEAANAVRTAGATATGAGDALQAAGRSMASGPSRTGFLATIASDGASPKWLRNAAYAGQVMDPLVGFAGATTEAAVHGAAMGGALGAAAEPDADGVFGGIGSGFALGAGFGAVGRLANRDAVLASKRQGDLNRWFNGKTPEEQANIAAMGLSADNALKFATLEQVARGINGANGEGDVRFVYADNAAFQRAFGGSAKGAEFVQGQTPTVVINVDRADAGTLPHEVFHGLLDLAVGDQAKAELNRKLFSQVAPDGTLLTDGAFSPEDLKRAQDQYVAKLPPELKAQWTTLSPEEQSAKIRTELAADAFSNLVQGHGTDYLLNGLSGVKRRMADAVVQAQEGSVLGQLRKGLENAGVKFDASGTPSELFVKDGRPITNSPQVDAALRDYLRAKERVRSRLVADEDAAAATIVTRQDMMSKNAKTISELYKDNDNFKKDAAGNVVLSGGLPVLQTEAAIKKVQAERAEAMMGALARVPDNGKVGAPPPATTPGMQTTPGQPGGVPPGGGRNLQPMRLKANGAWEGHYFTDEQLAEIGRIPTSIMAPSLKAKLRSINDFHKLGDGTRYVIDYNAATKEAKGGGRIYSSSIKSSLRDVVPITMHISKAGNFFSTTVDTTVLWSKLNRWVKSHPGALDAWGGDRDAVISDMFKYLDNHANGREGSVGLDAGAATAIHKKNVLNDLFGVARGTGANPLELSGPGGKDQIVRSFRFDRTNRITESGGEKMPFDYYKQKANFLPRQDENDRNRVQNMDSIYRAGTADEVGVKPFSSWSEDRETAEAYLDNPGFGGPILREEKYPLNNVLDADTTTRSGMIALAEALGFDREAGEQWFDNGYRYPWEESSKVKKALAASPYDAIRYIDDFPEGAKTIVPLREANNGTQGASQTNANFLPAPIGNKFEATTPHAGVPVKGHYELHEARDLMSSFDQGFDPALQPRDRSRAASVNQIATIVQKFEPQRLGEAPTTDLGAPVIDEQRQVLSGNGRANALRTIYGAQDPARAEAYKDYLAKNAAQFGFKPADLAAMTEPVLTRKVEDFGGLSKAEFARQSNQSQLLAMSGAEKAAADARMLTETPGLLDKFSPSEEGNVLADTNREFLNHFIQGTGDGAELLTENGYNQEALRKRVETAVMATLIGPEHRDLITKLIERSDKFKIRKAVNGLMASSSRLVKLQGTDYAVGGYVQEALANLIRMRGSGEKVEQFLASRPLIGNGDRTAAGDHVLEFLAKAQSMKQVREDLGRYFSMAQNAIADAQSGGLFGDAPRTREQLIAEIYGKLQRSNAQYPGNQAVATVPANQPAGQPAPLASQPISQPAGPGVALQPQGQAPGPVVPAPAGVVAPAAVITTAPAPITLRPRPAGKPAFITRPVPVIRRPLPGPGAVSPQAIIRHTTQQTITDLANRLAAGNLPLTTNARVNLAEYMVKRLDAASSTNAPDRKTDQALNLAQLAARISPADVSAIGQALQASGLTGAKKVIESQAKLKAALAQMKLSGHRVASSAV